MTKSKHIRTYKIAVFIIALLSVFMEANSVERATTVRFSEEQAVRLNTFGFDSDNLQAPSLFSANIQNDDTTGIVCPENISTYTDINACTSTISNGLNVADPKGLLTNLTWTMEGATDDASSGTGINQINSYAFNEGTTVITYRGKDRYNNSIYCTFTVTVADNQVPYLENLQENIIVGADLGECSAIVNWPEPIVTDNCMPASQILITGNYNSGSAFPIGTTEVFFVVSDGVIYNETEYNFTVTVTDEEPPEIYAP
ncbi:MAG: HYR domain-containing protein, partial [Bacteroidota bacterium]